MKWPNLASSGERGPRRPNFFFSNLSLCSGFSFVIVLTVINKGSDFRVSWDSKISYKLIFCRRCPRRRRRGFVSSLMWTTVNLYSHREISPHPNFVSWAFPCLPYLKEKALAIRLAPPLDYLRLIKPKKCLRSSTAQVKMGRGVRSASQNPLTLFIFSGFPVSYLTKILHPLYDRCCWCSFPKHNLWRDFVEWRKK